MRRQLKIFAQRGDTLIEAMLSIAVLGLVVVGCMAAMNHSNAAMLDAVERTEVRASINSQTEMLTYLRDQNLKTSGGDSTWNQIVGGVNGQSALVWSSSDSTDVANITDFSKQCSYRGNKSETGGGRSFWLSYSNVGEPIIDGGFGVTTNVASAETYAKPGQGLWIDGIYHKETSGDDSQDYIDFYVKACWDSVGGRQNMRTSTVLRLYTGSYKLAILSGGASSTPTTPTTPTNPTTPTAALTIQSIAQKPNTDQIQIAVSATGSPAANSYGYTCAMTGNKSFTISGTASSATFSTISVASNGYGSYDCTVKSYSSAGGTGTVLATASGSVVVSGYVASGGDASNFGDMTNTDFADYLNGLAKNTTQGGGAYNVYMNWCLAFPGASNDIAGCQADYANTGSTYWMTFVSNLEDGYGKSQ
jgi:Tfp pilus assembly protein PilV